MTSSSCPTCGTAIDNTVAGDAGLPHFDLNACVRALAAKNAVLGAAIADLGAKVKKMEMSALSFATLPTFTPPTPGQLSTQLYGSTAAPPEPFQNLEYVRPKK